MLTAVKNQGFSLIELMIGLVILGILVTAGFPAFNTYIQNNRVLASAESFNNMVQLARAEAVRRNAQAEFILTNASTGGTNTATASIAAVGGINWLVRTPDLTLPITTGQFEIIDSKFAAEGGTTVVSTNADNVASITFNGFGGTTLVAATIFNFGSSTLQCSPTGSVRCLAVRVAPGGQSRLCDPLITATSDTRSC